MQRGVRAGQAFAFQQVGHQVAHLPQVAQQRRTAGLHLGGFGQQLGVEAGAGERAAQFVADGQQQRALGFQHLVNVAAHGVDGGGQFAEFVRVGCMAQCNSLGKVTGTKTQGTGANVVQRAQHASHAGIGHSGEHQQQPKSDPADEAGAVVPGLHAQAEADAVAVYRGALKEPRGLIAPAIGIGRAVAQAVIVIGLIGVAAPVDQRTADVHAQRQALHQRLGRFNAGRAAQVGGQFVHIVHHQRAGGIAPANGQRPLHANDKNSRHGQCQQQEQRDQPHAQRVRQRVAEPGPHAPRGRLRALGRPGGAHPFLRASASE